MGRRDPPKVVSLGKMGRCEMRGPPKILDRPDGALGRPARSSQRRVAGRSPVRGGRLQFARRFWLRAAARDRILAHGPRDTTSPRPVRPTMRLPYQPQKILLTGAAEPVGRLLLPA